MVAVSDHAGSGRSVRSAFEVAVQFLHSAASSGIGVCATM